MKSRSSAKKAKGEIEDVDEVFGEGEAKPSKKKRAKKKASKKAATARLDSIIESAQPKSVTRMPRMNDDLTRIVETTFSVDDPHGLLDELEEALDKRGDALTPNVLREMLADSPRLYREAHRLYITARADFERYEVEYEAISGAMREEAQRELEKEKGLGLRTKAITNGDVEARLADMYPDEVAEMKERHLMARKTVEHLKHMVDVFKARGFALKALVGGREEL